MRAGAPTITPMASSPNVVILITDQQRRPMHWPDDPGWMRELMPNDAALGDTGLTFDRAFCSSAMCSPSRASLLTGLYPSRHGVTLTLTAGGLGPDVLENGPYVIGEMLGLLRRGGIDRSRVLAAFARSTLDIGPHSGGEPELPASLPNIATLLAQRGYHVAYKGKWHLTHPGSTEAETGLLSGWGPLDAERLSSEYGFHDWDPPDAGENAKAENFGGGSAGRIGLGWDEEYTRQTEEFLGAENLPEPFCLIVSLVNPHDVLGYPASYVRGGYSRSEFSELGVDLPSTVDEDLSSKPDAHSMMKMGINAYLGPLRDRAAQLDYVNFYAYLHSVVDRKIGRILDAMGDPGDPGSLRSRTLIVRTADHGEMGLSHGGLRQKMFNAYEETIAVPLVFSNPTLFPEPRRTEALATLVDIVPTVLEAAGADTPEDLHGASLAPVLASKAVPDREALARAEVDLSNLLERDSAESIRDAVHFSFDDHQAATALQNTSGQPNRVRTARTDRHKLSVYFDPSGRKPAEYEMYDLDRDPIEVDNLVDYRTGEVRNPDDRRLREELGEVLDDLMADCESKPPPASMRVKRD